MSQTAIRLSTRTHRGSGGWLVTAIESVGGLARVGHSGEVTEVVVADTSARGAFDPECFAAAACTQEGDVLLVSRQSPPALLVSGGDKRIAPAASLDSELLHLQQGDRLVILSPAVFEQLPEALAHTLHSAPADLLAADPAALLSEIFEGVSAGAGVVIGRAAHITDRGGSR